MDINDYIEDGKSLAKEYRDKMRDIQSGDYLPEDDSRPLKIDDEFLEENSESIPMESLERVDEDIKRNYFGDFELDEEHRKNRFLLFEEYDSQTEYDRFMYVLNDFVSSKMTNAHKEPMKDCRWSFTCHEERLPKWRWYRPKLKIEAKRIFDLWCCEFLEHRSMPISYMWSFLKSRLIIHGWTNRGIGRKKWDWSKNQMKCSGDCDGDSKSYIEENPIPAFEYSADWEKAEKVELNYLKAIEEILMRKWDKQTKKSAPFININEWKKLCNLLMDWKIGHKAKVIMNLEPNVHVVSKTSSHEYTCWYSEITCDGLNHTNKSSIHLKNQIIPFMNFSRFESDEETKTVIIWLTGKINDEVYKAFEVRFEKYDENEPIDGEEIAEKMARGVSEELNRFATK